MGVAALMLKANPELSPSEIQDLMGQHTRDVQGGRRLDGNGAIQPVELVREAARRGSTE
jgi:hypothetical protein